MKRLPAVFFFISIICCNLFAQETITTPGPDETEFLKHSSLDYWIFGSVPAIVLAWGLGAWGWGSASKWHFENDGWGIEQDSYTGGADKFGHSWGIYTISRIGSFAFEANGDSPGRAALKGFLFGQFMGLGIEIGDGFGDTYGFAFGDMVWNLAGGIIALAFDLYPNLDDLFGFQIEYWPSKDHLNQEKAKWFEITSDVTGQKFIFSLKFSGIPWIKDTISQFFQIDFGYYTRGYWFPDSSYSYKTRHAYIGFALNLSRISEKVLPPGCWKNSFSRFFKYYHAPAAYNPEILDNTLQGKVKNNK